MPQFATIEYLTDGIGAEWNSGEVVSVELFDPDMNFDQRSEDAMTCKHQTPQSYQLSKLVPQLH